MLEKTLESPLDCKEFQPVHPKGVQSWVFIEGTDAEAELQYFGHLMRRVDSLKKTLMQGRIGGRRRRGRLLGAGVRHSALGKGHEEGGSTYAKAGSSLRSPPGNPRASIPITRACLPYCFVLSPTPLIYGGLSPTTSFGEGVNLELQLIKTPGRDKSVLTYKLL